MHTLRRLYVDGGVLGGKNPSTEGIYYSVAAEGAEDGRYTVVHARVQDTTLFTNNNAEYAAVIAGLRFLLQWAETPRDNPPGAHPLPDLRAAGGPPGVSPGGTTVELWSDSQLIVNQMNRKWQVSPWLRTQWTEAQCLLSQLRDGGRGRSPVTVHFQWTPRETMVRILGH